MQLFGNYPSVPLTTAFRMSFFVTLALACACLALAETFFLWWMGYFLVGTLVLVCLAYRYEGRWLLSADAANRLGMIIAIGAAFWILAKLPRSEEDLQATGVPWPAGLLPHLGPVLLVLLLVKLFRPKRLPDFWVIQTIGLMMVTLGCVLAAEPLFGALLVLYLSSLVWSLALYYLVRGQAMNGWGLGAAGSASAATVPLFVAPGTEGLAPPPWRVLGLGRVARWAGVMVPLGLILFLVAPRQDNFQWEPKQLTRAMKGIMRTGFDSGMDLNRVGKIEMSDEPAFEVEARDAQGPKLDLNPETRWFVQTLDYYFQGRWTGWGQGAAPPHMTWGISPKSEPLALPGTIGNTHPRVTPAALAADETYLYFKVRLPAAGGLVLAEPLTGTRLGLNPQLGESPVQLSLFFHQVGTDCVISSPPHGRRRLYQYGQVLRRPADPDRTPVKEVNAKYKQFLINQDVPDAINLWVHDLLDNLPELSEAERDFDAKGRLPAPTHAKVAQALTKYLTQSGEFGYSLDLHRYQMNLDPLADFLLNVKEGHCERYAGGLNLMLRALGIPARVIKGYRGVEPLEDGRYLVRQRQAHSWVQALIEDGRGPYWLTLDPTPSSERSVKPLLSWLSWLFQRWSESDNVWRSLIMDYNADQQSAALDLLERQFAPEDVETPAGMLLATGGVLAGSYGALRLWRRRHRLARSRILARTAKLESIGMGFYPRFLNLSKRLLKLQPEPGQTPREFCLLACFHLQDLGVDAECTTAPLKLVDLLYRVRCGGQILTAAEECRANLLVATVEQRLRAARAGVTAETSS
jgi:protein-glutamine gamma-glutamyltransferase